MDLISKQTRIAFREHLVGWTLRTISDLFDAADIEMVQISPEQLPTGERRALVEQYYAGVDWSSSRDIRKVLRAYEQVLAELQPDSDAHRKLANLLRRDGFTYEDGHLGSTGIVDLAKVEDASSFVDRLSLHDHLRRIEQSVESDPAPAIGSAKELVETVAKLVLRHYSQDPDQYDTVQQLVKQAMKCLNLSAEDIPKVAKGADSIRQILAGLGQAVGGIVELRNLYGTGHGRVHTAGLQPRHVRLVVGASSTICMFFLETLDARKSVGEKHGNKSHSSG